MALACRKLMGIGIFAWAKLERWPPLSKFDPLCELLELSFPKGRRPLQTIEQLFEFCNSLAHGRTTILTPDDSHRDIDDTIDKFLGDMPRTSWELLIKDAAFAERAREDTNAILEKLQHARPEPKEPLFTPQHVIVRNPDQLRRSHVAPPAPTA
jgi:hypothetical protein